MKMMLIVWLGAVAGVATSFAADSALPLWKGTPPGALGEAPRDIPTVTPFLPEQAEATGAAIVIFPGGGYGALADHEGAGYARWFNELGLAGFVVKYRLGSNGYRHPAMLQDAARSVRWVRAHASEYGVDPERIGVIGSSAGGHLASTILTHFDHGNVESEDPVERLSSRPDWGILCYPVITMQEFTHQGSRRNLLGENPDSELLWLLSNELQVSPQTPPCFLWHTLEDKGVPMENSLMFAQALRKANVPFALHIYQKGRHGIGLAGNPEQPESLHPWTRDCAFWLKENGFLK